MSLSQKGLCPQLQGKEFLKMLKGRGRFFFFSLRGGAEIGGWKEEGSTEGGRGNWGPRTQQQQGRTCLTPGPPAAPSPGCGPTGKQNTSLCSCKGWPLCYQLCGLLQSRARPSTTLPPRSKRNSYQARRKGSPTVLIRKQNHHKRKSKTATTTNDICGRQPGMPVFHFDFCAC